MNQINSGGTNYQTQTGVGNTNHFGETNYYQYPAAPPAIAGQPFQIPYSRNPHFTGRSELLLELHQTLGRTGAAALNQARAICGLGGVGKTQTAIEYAYRYFYEQKCYDWVLWVNASQLTLEGSFGAIATKLALPHAETQVLEEQIAAVRHWLETHDRWLLIFDNVDDPTALQPFRPGNANGRLLITSRLQRFESLGLANPIALDTLSAEEAQQFLRHRTERSAIDLDEEEAIAALAQALGYLPLALEQAAAYVQTKGSRFAAYLRSYQRRRLRLLEKQNPQAGNYPDSVATTWAINFEAVQLSSPAAAAALTLSAFLAPDNIPYELLTRGKDHLGELLSQALADATEDELVILELLEELTRYSLIRLEASDCYSIHRMVQEVLRDAMAVTTQQQWIDRGIAALNEVFPNPVLETWGQCARLVAHVQALESRMAMLPELTETAARLLNQGGYYLHEQGRYGEAEPLYVRSLHIYEQQLGADHPDTAISLNNLALLYYTTGRYGEAEPLYVRSLHIREQQLGANHPDTAQSLNNLAALYDTTGRYGEAEPLYVRSLHIREQQLGADHPDTALSLNNLAALYDTTGRYGEAEPLYVRSLHIYEQQLGADHPDTAISLNNLALLYYTTGRYGEAEPLYVRSLHIYEQQLGADHPGTALSLNNLALLYYTTGRYGEAEPLYVRSLHIYEQQLGADHPDTAQSLNNLAALYTITGRYEEAEPLYVRSLHIYEQQLGADHPGTALSLNNLAGLYDTTGRYGEAELLYLRALAIFLDRLGDHPNTQTVRSNFMECLKKAIESGQAAQLSDHPTTQSVLEQLRRS